MAETAIVPNGADRIAAERQRQVEAEGWTPDHDDEHDVCELSCAARCYIDAALICERADVTESAVRRGLVSRGVVPETDPDFLAMLAHPVVHHYGGGTPDVWPWHPDWWKPSTDPVRNLVKAGALIAAEIDRLQRADNGRSGDPSKPPSRPDPSLTERQLWGGDYEKAIGAFNDSERKPDPEAEYHRMRRWVQRGWERMDPNPMPRFSIWPFRLRRGGRQ